MGRQDNPKNEPVLSPLPLLSEIAGLKNIIVAQPREMIKPPLGDIYNFCIICILGRRLPEPIYYRGMIRDEARAKEIMGEYRQIEGFK